MLSGCPALNSLTLGYSSGFRQFKINALKLKYVNMYFHGSDADRLQELIVENAPCLETLHHEGPYKDNMHISIISAPKLKILGRLTDNISRLELGFTVFKGLPDVRMATVMRTLKVLALRLDKLRLDVVINFMKCFPCVEKLYIKTPTAGENTQRHCSPGRIECFDHHLKKLQISYYSGKRPHAEFAKFFLLLNAGVLESLVLDASRNNKFGWWIENQRRQLCPEKKASVGAQIDFTFGDCSSYLRDG
ncbi:uncharacterized protein LOC120706378 [Panicum virgatum]|uniref:uncharacterized protein LOC120706378 n=1 Tax=Panicum virgatum TaxID=38727 RepID=UPI0019D4FEDA|nr:uncharacterized protein LOC120706378 [Panicum virgatum]